MSDLTLARAQADMRAGYASGAPGALVSGGVWLLAGLIALGSSPRAAMVALLAGGMAIHPIGVLLARVFGYRGAHTAGNPLARLAGESTVWLLAGIVVACGVSLFRPEWFFPAMLLTIGGRYLTFQTIYGLRAYWVLGGTLCALGIALGLAGVSVPVGAFAGGGVEIAGAVLLFRQVRQART